MGIDFNHQTGEIEGEGDLTLADTSYYRNLSELLDVPVPQGYIWGMRLHFSTSSSLFATAGICKNDDSDGSIVFTGNTFADLDTTGAGGLDTGTKAADTLYSVFAIADSYGVNSPNMLVSTSFDTPTMPSGYDKKRRLGSIMLGASSDLEVFQMDGDGPTRLYLYNDKASNSIHRFINNGTSASFTTADASDTIPQSAHTIIILVIVDSSSVSNQCFFRQSGHSASSPVLRTQFGVFDTTSPTATMWVPVDSSGQFEYKTANIDTGVTFFTVGYVENLTVG